jgi:transcriptional pleiotropic regulator of transition state genes
MRETGIIRRIDDLGRVVIPREIRKQFLIKEGDQLEIFVNKDEIILKKYDVSIGMKELVRRLDDEFSDVKGDMETEIANNIYKHISALKDILKNMDNQ